jgi:hypothetical protein
MKGPHTVSAATVYCTQGAHVDGRGTEEGPNTRFVLTIRAAGVATPEIASALIASGAKAPPAVRATAVSGAAPLRATAAAQAQHVRPRRGSVPAKVPATPVPGVYRSFFSFSPWASGSVPGRYSPSSEEVALVPSERRPSLTLHHVRAT